MTVDGKKMPATVIPEEFLKLGVRGIQAFAFKVGNEAAKEQEKKGNELAYISVDNYPSRPVTQMKRNIRWQFSLKNAQLVKAVSESLEMLKKLSVSYAREATGKMAQSWDLYIDGQKSTLFDLENIQIGDKKDIRISSPLPYARWLESGHWAATRSLKRRLTRAQRQLEGKKVRAQISVTKAVAASMRKKYPLISIFDVWYETDPFGFSYGKDRRHPAIKFTLRKRVT
jgi:hypothetical protein